MDPMPPSIVVVMPCKPEVIIEEDLEDLNEDEFAATTKVSIPESDEASAETQNPKVVHLQIPPRASPKSKKAREHQEKKKRTPEMAKVVSSLQFIKKWVEKRGKFFKEKDVRFKKADGLSPTHKMERNAEELNKKWCIWGEKYFPLNPSQSILYWYDVVTTEKCILIGLSLLHCCACLVLYIFLYCTPGSWPTVSCCWLVLAIVTVLTVYFLHSNLPLQ